MNLLVVVVGVAIGITVGALPGFTATLGIAIALPLTFGMPPEIGLTLLVTIFAGGIHGGSIPGILLNTPGTPAAAATTIDGHPMALKGEAGRALGIDAFSSGTGGFLSALILTFATLPLARIALQFGPLEYFALGVFGLTVIASISSQSVIKGLVAAVLGLLISTIGIDPIVGVPRFTMGEIHLFEGVSVVPAVIGLFAISQVFTDLEKHWTALQGRIVEKVNVKLPSLKEIKSLLPTIIRSSLLGTIIGAIPGPGSVLGAFIPYGTAKRRSKTPELFGKGAPEGIAAAESGNNSAVSGALIPTFALGIPGEAATAVLLGGLMIVGLRPGPMLMRDNPELVYAVFAALLIANLLLIGEGLLLARVLSRVITIPRPYLGAAILLFSVLGTYGINYSVFDIGVGLAFGILGYVLKKLEYPVTPVLLALILGPMIESNLRRAIIVSRGDVSFFFTRPITIALVILTGISLALGIRSSRKLRKIEAELSESVLSEDLSDE
jgi:putative tricarboxylic transport membrane protein